LAQLALSESHTMKIPALHKVSAQTTMVCMVFSLITGSTKHKPSLARYRSS
jgi:hypothetical protein